MGPSGPLVRLAGAEVVAFRAIMMPNGALCAMIHRFLGDVDVSHGGPTYFGLSP